MAVLTLFAAIAAAGRVIVVGEPTQNAIEIVNVSYDPTRELYKDYNPAFAEYWAEANGPTRDREDVARRLGQRRPGA